MEKNKVGNSSVRREENPEWRAAGGYGMRLAKPSDVSRENTDLMNGMLGLARVYSTEFLSQWLLMLRSGMEFWATLPTQVTQSVRAVDREVQEAGAVAESANEEEQEEEKKESPRTKGRNKEEIERYQRELIRLDAHQIWLRRKQEGIQGDPESDWVEAERQYYSHE